VIAYVCPACGAAADPLNADESWRFSATGTLVEHVHDGIRSLCRKIEVVAAPLSREGWRPRLAHVERLLTVAMTGGGPVGAADDGEVAQALAEVRGLLDGDASTEGLVHLWPDDLMLLDSLVESVKGEGHDVRDGEELLERLRREVGA
jgi:hypothetical protein